LSNPVVGVGRPPRQFEVAESRQAGSPATPSVSTFFFPEAVHIEQGAVFSGKVLHP
jgi:hypothetical protein